MAGRKEREVTYRHSVLPSADEAQPARNSCPGALRVQSTSNQLTRIREKEQVRGLPRVVREEGQKNLTFPSPLNT